MKGQSLDCSSRSSRIDWSSACLLAIIGAVIDHQFQHRFALARGGDDVLDLLGREHDLAVEIERLRNRLLQLDRDVVVNPFRHAIDRRGLGVVHPGVDLEAIALAGRILPGGRAQIAQRQLALAAVELRHLAEFAAVALAGIARKIVEDAPARARYRIGAARLDELEFVERLMGEKRAACACERWSDSEAGSNGCSNREHQSTDRNRERASHVLFFPRGRFVTLVRAPLRRN